MLRSRFLLWRRHPLIAYRLLLTWLIVRLSRAELDHCAFGTAGVVLTISLSGVRFWPFWTFVRKYPRLALVYRVPLRRSVDLTRYEGMRRPRPAMTVLKWWTFGAIRTRDCVCVTRQCLIAAGVPVPRRIVSPAQLEEYLRVEGYESITFA